MCRSIDYNAAHAGVVPLGLPVSSPLCDIVVHLMQSNPSSTCLVLAGVSIVRVALNTPCSYAVMCVCQVRGVFLGAPPFECAYSGQMKSAADVTHPSKVPDKGFPCHMPCRSFKVPEHYVAVKAYVVRNCTENAAAAAAPVG